MVVRSGMVEMKEDAQAFIQMPAIYIKRYKAPVVSFEIIEETSIYERGKVENSLESAPEVYRILQLILGNLYTPKSSMRSASAKHHSC